MLNALTLISHIYTYGFCLSCFLYFWSKGDTLPISCCCGFVAAEAPEVADTSW